MYRLGQPAAPLPPPLDARVVMVALASTPRGIRSRAATVILRAPLVVRAVRAVISAARRLLPPAVLGVRWLLNLAVAGPRPPPELV